MKPILFEIPGLNLPIHAYGVMVVVGFILAIMLSTRRAKKRSLDPNLILDLGVYLIIFGIIGARIWFVYQFKEQFDLGVLNIFDGRLSIIGAVLGIAFVALLYLYRGRIEFLGKLRESKRGVKIAFVMIGVVAAILFSRVFYCLLDREANIHIAYVNDPSLFYPESLRREVAGTVGSGSGEGSTRHESSVFRVVGRYASGPNVAGEGTVAYEFPKYRYEHTSSGEEVKRFRVEEALLRKLGVVRFQSAFYYDFLEIWKGGLVYYGGVIGAILGGLLFSYRRKFPFWKLADLVAPGVALGLAAGRIGCLLNGCCWGKIPANLLPHGLTVPTNAQRIVGKAIPLLSKFSATFPEGSNAFKQHIDAGLIKSGATQSLPVYLTQPLESLAAVALCLIVLAFSKYKRRDGEEILLLGMLYAVVRFFIELLRADNEPEYLFGLTISQTAGIFIFIFCAFLFALRKSIAKPIGIEKAEVRRQK